jgi:4-hydroxythreonine-4-phosphate dehydrogenase
MSIKPIIIVPGEIKSIFFEIFFKSLKIKRYKSPLILICNYSHLNSQKKKFNFKKKFELINLETIKYKKLSNKIIYVIDVKMNDASKYIEKCFKISFNLLKNNLSHKLINGPINKKKTLNKKYLGVTEFIAKKFNKKKIAMLIYNKKLSVSPLTTHLPLKLVANKISKNLIIEKIRLIDSFYKKYFRFRPVIGITGLNPHCESVLKFNEDEKIIAPIVKLLKNKKFKVEGPFAADTIFLKKNRSKFHVILGMYHDQVLTPLKTIFEYDAINITIGLPFLRVSPDHGPNEKMFGKNKSNPESLINALNFLDNK